MTINLILVNMKTLTKKSLNSILSVNWGYKVGCLSIVYCLLAMGFVYAGPPTHSNTTGNKITPPPSPLSNCVPGSAKTDLDINNVRATMLTGGDMWWDYTRAADN